MVEKGRHLHIERDLRMSLYFQQQGVYIVGDKVHFLLYCSMYQTLRQTYFLNRLSIHCVAVVGIADSSTEMSGMRLVPASDVAVVVLVDVRLLLVKCCVVGASVVVNVSSDVVLVLGFVLSDNVVDDTRSIDNVDAVVGVV